MPFAAMGQDIIILISSDNKEVEIIQDAAQLSGTLKTLLEFSPEEKVYNISAKFAVLQKVVAILEDIYQELTPRLDSEYITQEVQDIVDEKLKDKKREIDFLFNVMNVANFLEIPFLVNAATKVLVQNNESQVRETVAKKDTTKIPIEVYIYLKKHLKLKEAGVEKELSVMDLIAQYYGTPIFFKEFMKKIFKKKELLQISNKKITSLYGLDLLVKMAEKIGIKSEDIKNIDLSDNYILDNDHEPLFPKKPLSSFKNITDINFTNNILTTLPKDIFKGHNSLLVVKLESNKLKYLPEGIFQGLNKLTEIVLKSNQLESLPKSIFQGLNDLVGIDLGNNKLKSLPDGIFQGLNSLRGIKLDNNSELKSLPEGIFQGINLMFLFLENTPLSEKTKVMIKDLNITMVE